MRDVMIDVLHDSIPMLPFLFITYAFMEYIEHKGSEKLSKGLKNASKLGPLIGSIFGIIPQCGFSVVASGLYMNGSITLGTLLAVFISTSDEAIPILISQPAQATTLLYVICIKLVIAIAVGYLVDRLVVQHHLKENHPLHDIHAECDEEEKEQSIWMIALVHTLKIFVFVFIVNFALSYLIHMIGESSLKALMIDGSLWQPVIASIAGFIPNCAASVILAQLYMEGVLSFGSLCAGLITSAGLGLLVLLRMYDNKRDILRILFILFLTAVGTGLFLQLFL